jgi:hypothetical protein
MPKHSLGGTAGPRCTTICCGSFGFRLVACLGAWCTIESADPTGSGVKVACFAGGRGGGVADEWDVGARGRRAQCAPACCLCTRLRCWGECWVLHLLVSRVVRRWRSNARAMGCRGFALIAASTGSDAAAPHRHACRSGHARRMPSQGAGHADWCKRLHLQHLQTCCSAVLSPVCHNHASVGPNPPPVSAQPAVKRPAQARPS